MEDTATRGCPADPQAVRRLRGQGQVGGWAPADCGGARGGGASDGSTSPALHHVRHPPTPRPRHAAHWPWPRQGHQASSRTVLGTVSLQVTWTLGHARDACLDGSGPKWSSCRVRDSGDCLSGAHRSRGLGQSRGHLRGV